MDGRLPNQQNGAEEDDFDFGGFETADPVPEMQGLQAEAQVSPWAAFAAGNAQERPDLLCAQNRFPVYLDPSDIVGVSGADRNHNDNHADLALHPPVAADLLGDAQFAQARLPDRLEPADSSLNGLCPLNVNGRLPDLGLGINDGHLFRQPVLGGVANEAPVAAAAVPEPVADERLNASAAVAVVVPVSGEQPVNDVLQNPGMNAQEEEEELPDEAVVDNINQPAEQNESGEDKEEMTRQLNSLRERNQALEEELEKSRSELAVQRSRLEEIEARHSQTLEDVRQAGHDSLAVVVEQYKEQLKVAVSEQQESCQQSVLEALREQMSSFQELLQTQKQKHEEERSEDQGEVKRQIAVALEQTRVEEQEKFQSFLEEEKEKWKTDLEKAVQDERLACQASIQQVVKEERDAASQRLEEARAEYTSFLEQEKQQQETALVTVRQEEAERAREYMDSLVSEERQRGRESVREALEAARADTRSYIDEQRQADGRVRRRHLASLDLFLESCRQQVALLVEHEHDKGATWKPPAPKEDSESHGDEES